MAFCVGRWVAATNVTATARPRRATESAAPVASGASSASSAYSSTTITSAGVSGDGSHTRCPDAASIEARASRTATASASRARASAGVVASRSMHEAHGPSSMPRLRSIAQMTTSRQAARLPIRTLRPPLLPEPDTPPRSTCRRSNSTLAAVASSNGPRSNGSLIVAADGPGQVIASACGSADRTRNSNRWARSGGHAPRRGRTPRRSFRARPPALRPGRAATLAR